MTLTDLLSAEIPVVNPSDNVRTVLDLMEDCRCSFLPVVDNLHLVALVSEQALLDANDSIPVSQFVYSDAKVPCVTADASVFDVLAVISSSHSDVVPVVDVDMRYLGSIGQSSMLESLSQMCGATNPGKSVVVSAPLCDYSLTRIANIVEECDVKIISMLSTVSHGDVNLMLKFNSDNVESVIRSLERYGYNVLSYGSLDGNSDDTIRRNYDCLMKYLDLVDN